MIMRMALRVSLSSGIFPTILTWKRRYAAPFYALAFLFTYQLATLFNELRGIACGKLKLLRTIASP
ncbi:MAG: hypothetical protein ABFS02_12395 [Pseudomonadota bacterium]